MKKDIYVVGAVIIKEDHILCAQRGPNQLHTLDWAPADIATIEKLVNTYKVK